MQQWGPDTGKINNKCCCCLATKLYPTLWDPTDCNMPVFPAFHYLPEFVALVMPSNPLILCHPLLLQPSVFPSIRVFFFFSPKSQLFSSGGQSIRAPVSKSILPMSIQGLFPLRLTGLISLLSKALSRVFSSTTVWKQNSLALCLLYGPALTSIHDYWKDNSFDCTTLYWQSDIFAFKYTV